MPSFPPARPSFSPARDVIVSIDQGTTNTKAVLVDAFGRVLASGSAPVGVHSPATGWVEQRAELVWTSVLEAVAAADIESYTIVGVALSTQRESVVGWDASTGRPVGPVIGWQDRRTADWCASAFDDEARAVVRKRTGLQIDPMFSAPKLRWLLDHLPTGVATADVRVGTVDSWLLWNLTGGAAHRCEAGNASRTLLYDVVELRWGPDLLDLFGIPPHVLPQVEASNGAFGVTAGVAGLADGIPILAVMADSHAALFGQGCTTPGMAKATYGTGSSVMTPVSEFVASTSAVPTTLAWVTDRPTYAREGNILATGAALAWTADMLLGGRVADLMTLAETVADSGGVTLVPAFSGLGAPHWDRDATAVISGMTASTSAAHIARAAIEAVGHQVSDVVEAIELDGERLTTFRADGGITVSDLAMQTQADLLGRAIEVADVPEVSALGAAQLGWLTLEPTLDWSAHRGAPRIVTPRLAESERLRRRARWTAEVGRSRLSIGQVARQTS